MRKGLLTTIYVIFFFAVGGAVLAFDIQNEVISSPKFIKQSLAETDIYQRFVEISAKDLDQIIPAGDTKSGNEISTAELQKLISSVSPHTLQTTVEDGLDQYYDAYLNGKSTASIDLSRIKADVLANQPTGIAEELDAAAPNTYVVKINSSQNSLAKFFTNKNVKYLSLIFLALLFIAGILLAQGARGRVKAAATFCLIAGVVVSLMWYISTLLPVSSVTTLIGPNVSAYLLRIIQDLATVLLSRFSRIFQIQGFVLLGIGAILLIGSYFLPKQLEMKNDASNEAKTAVKPEALDKQE